MSTAFMLYHICSIWGIWNLQCKVCKYSFSNCIPHILEFTGCLKVLEKTLQTCLFSFWRAQPFKINCLHMCLSNLKKYFVSFKLTNSKKTEKINNQSQNLCFQDVTVQKQIWICLQVLWKFLRGGTWR